MTDQIDAVRLGELIEGYRRKVFRMESRPMYAVGDDYRRWAAGEVDPMSDRKQQWLDVLRADREAGKVRYRVRILSEQLTDYELYSCAWGYQLNTVGEDIRVLHRGEHPLPDALIERDHWVIDDDLVLVMHYDDDGVFVGAEVAPDVDPYLAARDKAWATAEPFVDWWRRQRTDSPSVTF